MNKHTYLTLDCVGRLKGCSNKICLIFLVILVISKSQNQIRNLRVLQSNNAKQTCQNGTKMLSIIQTQSHYCFLEIENNYFIKIVSLGLFLRKSSIGPLIL